MITSGEAVKYNNSLDGFKQMQIVQEGTNSLFKGASINVF
jgi:solute carrier family 25 (adenine nucleotide translocator) protein 4/5/6/31